MSSNAEHEPLNASPAERRLQWRLNADVRTQIRIGIERFGEDEFLAYLSLPEAKIDSLSLLDGFERHYVHSFDTLRQLEDDWLRFCRSNGYGIQEFIVESHIIPGELEIDYGLVDADLRNYLRVAEMGGRVHAFTRA